MGDHGRVKAFERCARAELRLLGADQRSSVLAKALVTLARRLDDDPEDSMTVALTRELRQVSAALRLRAGVSGEAEEFLARVRTPAFSQPGD